MSGRSLITTRLLAERLGIQPIDCADGTRLSPLAGGIEIATPDTGIVTVTVRYGMFGHEPVTAAESDWEPEPPELERRTRDGLAIVQRRGATPCDPDRSDWIDGSVQPTIVGPYLRDLSKTLLAKVFENEVAWSMWDGQRWRWPATSPEIAASRDRVSGLQHLRWRGLAHDPALFRGHAS